jgi:hypothetical protein
MKFLNCEDIKLKHSCQQSDRDSNIKDGDREKEQCKKEANNSTD